MPRRGDIPPVREEEFSIEIDMRRGKWPYLKAAWGTDQKARVRLLVVVDANEGGQVIGEGANQAVLAISKKKAIRLAKWILKTADNIPD